MTGHASVWRQVLAVLALPCVVAIVVPGVLLWSFRDVSAGWALPGSVSVVPIVLGVALLCAGLALVAWTVSLFLRVGHGTLAPWDPTTRLVVRGPYKHMRNPMISGVGAVLLGEAVLLGSPALLVWFAAFAAVNAVYMPLVEEPGLRRRFGEEYDRYRAEVPRWLPRR